MPSGGDRIRMDKYIEVWLPDAVAKDVEARMGLPAVKVRAMTLRRYVAGTWPDSTYHRQNWVLATRSNACPNCLRENGSRWLLAWRMTLIPVCPLHRRYLVTRCTCGRVLHRVALRAGRTSFWCPSRTPVRSDQVPCAKPPSELDALPVSDSVMLDIQERVLAVFRDRRHQDAGTTQVELRWATALVAAVGTPELVRDSDDVMIEAFARFCRDRDSGAVPTSRRSGPMPASPRTLMTAARENCLITAALVRAAARLVLVDDLDAEADRFCEITQPDWTSDAATDLGLFHFMPARRVIEQFVRRGFTGAP